MKSNNPQIKPRHMIFYRIIIALCAAVFIIPFFQLFLTPESFLSGVGLKPDGAAAIITRRASIFMLGLAVLLIGSFRLKPSNARQAICLSVGITMIGLACMSYYEYNRGAISSAIIPAICIESTFGLSFLALFFMNLKRTLKQK